MNIHRVENKRCAPKIIIISIIFAFMTLNIEDFRPNYMFRAYVGTFSHSLTPRQARATPVIFKLHCTHTHTHTRARVRSHSRSAFHEEPLHRKLQI